MTLSQPTIERTTRLRVLLPAGWTIVLLTSACPGWTDPMVCVGDCPIAAGLDNGDDRDTSTLDDSIPSSTTANDSSGVEESGDSAVGNRPSTFDASCGNGSQDPGELCLDPASWFVEPLLPTGNATAIASRGRDPQVPDGTLETEYDVVFFESRNASLELAYLAFGWNELGVNSSLHRLCPLVDSVEAFARIDTDGPMRHGLLVRSAVGLWAIPASGLSHCSFQHARYLDAQDRVDMGLPAFLYIIDENDVSREFRYGAWSWADGRVRYDWAESESPDAKDPTDLTQFVVSSTIESRSAVLWASGDLMTTLGPELVGLRHDALVIGYGFPSDPRVTTIPLPPDLRLRDHELGFLEVADLDARTPMDLVVVSSEGDGRPSWLTYLFIDQAGPERLPRIAHIFELELPPGPHQVQSGHLNADDTRDVLVVHRESNQLSIVIGGHRGAALRPMPLDPAIAPESVILGDLNADGATDLVFLGNPDRFSGVLPAEP